MTFKHGQDAKTKLSLSQYIITSPKGSNMTQYQQVEEKLRRPTGGAGNL